MLSDVLTAIGAREWETIWVGAVITGLELAIPGSRYALVTRARALLFWTVHIVITMTVLILFARMWATLGIAPLVILHIDGWFDHPYLRACGWVAAPVIALTITDFFYYWFHRMQHTVPLFWRFHAVHHSLQEMSGLNSNHHVTDEIFRIPFITLPVSLLLAPDPGHVPMVVAAVLGMHGFYQHSCTRVDLGPLRFVITDNRYHRLHHSIEPEHMNRNFASVTPLWDLLFRTMDFPDRKLWPKTGVAGMDEPRTLADFLLRPFKRYGCGGV